MKISVKQVNRTDFCLCLLFPAILFVAPASVGQDAPGQRVSPDVDIKFVSAELRRFEKPIRLGVGKRIIEYQEALVLKALANREKFDSLPPSMEPFLYIGRREVRIYHIDRSGERRELLLTFHIRDWGKLPNGAPVVLTIDHGGPLRRPEEFIRRAAFRFRKDAIVDKR